MMKEDININSSEIPFDYPREERLSICDRREIICIDIDRMGDRYRAIINGFEVEMPVGLPTITDAGKVAIEIAIAEIARSAKELIDQYFE